MRAINQTENTMARFIFEKHNRTGEYKWAITRDLLGDPNDTFYTAATEEQKAAVKKDCKHHFKLYDDDDVLYYEGYSNDDSSFDPLDWAMADSGCTSIKYR